MAVLIEEKTAAAELKKERIDILDLLRGAAMIYVMLYHLLFDLVYFAGVYVPFWGSGWFEGLHTFFLIVLFSVSGICTAFSRNIIKRGAVIYFLGCLLTLFTELFMPENVIVFGVLSFFGVMMMLCGLIRPAADKLDPWAAAAVCVLLYAVFFDFMNEQGTLHLLFTDVHIPLPDDRKYLYPIGILSGGFFSADYFPVIPNGFIYLAGFFLSGKAKDRKFPAFFYKKINVPAVNFIGKHSLVFYIVHQPVFMGATLLLTILK